MAIRDLFFKSEETPKPVPQVNNTPVQNIPTNIPVSNVSVGSTISSNDEIVGKIWDEIISKNLPGPDYLELKNNVSALEGMPLTDEQKLISSFNILKKNYPTFNKDIILRSIDTYINIVNDEKESGLKEVARLRSEKIDSVEKEISDLKSEASILKQKYDEILKKIDDKTTNIAAERLSIDSQERMFTASVDTVLNTLSSDKSKISTINI